MVARSPSARMLTLRDGRLAWRDDEEEGVALARPFRLEVWRAHRGAVVEARQAQRRVRFGVLVAPDDPAAWDALPRLDADVDVVDASRLGPLWAQLVAHAQLHGERVAWDVARVGVGGGADGAPAAAQAREVAPAVVRASPRAERA